MKIAIKIILAVLFILCILDMPYGFFQFVRFAALIGFSVLAFNFYNEGFKSSAIFYLGLALLFQPFVKLALGRPLWNIVDVLVAIFLIATLLFKKNKI